MPDRSPEVRSFPDPTTLQSHHMPELHVDHRIPVLAAVVRRGESFLLARRPAHKRHGGLWEFPGGKLEEAETLLDAARRELREELGVDVVSVGESIWSRQDPGSAFEIVFVAVEIEGEPCALEHDELQWIEAAALPGFNLAPTDRAFADLLLGRA